MQLQLTPSTVSAMLTYLGVEAQEGKDPNALLDDTLGDYNLTRDQFLTPETCFAMGFHRGMGARAFSEEQAPSSRGEDGKAIANPELLQAIEEGYGYGLEARDLKLSPPPSLVYEAHKSGALSQGAMAAWADTLDLSSGHRLSQALTVGSGKDAVVIPAGTPIDLLGEATKDGVPHLVALYDGAALLIPNPSDAPRVVSATTEIAPAAKARKARKAKEGGEAKTREPRERGPSLKDAIIYVIEGRDGGPGPLQTNGSFANRVLKRCREVGIGDKAASFMQKSDRHVPYYLNCYKPNDTDGKSLTGRLGVEQPLIGVCAAIEARKYFLKSDGKTFEEKVASIPDELRKKMADKDGRYTTEEPPAKVSTKADENGAPDADNGGADDAVAEAAPAPKAKGGKAKGGKKS